MTSLKFWPYRNSFEINLIFVEAMHHRHLRDQDETVVHRLINRYTFTQTTFLLYGQKASRYQKYVASHWFFLEL